MNIFVICSVREASKDYRNKLENYVKSLEDEGHHVHLPHRDIDQNVRGLEICQQNYFAIKLADRVDIFYSSSSQDTHFDMGMTFAFFMSNGKKIKIVNNEEYVENKSYSKILDEWSQEYDKKYQILTFKDPNTGKYYMQNFYHFYPDKYKIDVAIRKSDSRVFGVGTNVKYGDKKDKIKDFQISNEPDDLDLDVSFVNSNDIRKLSNIEHDHLSEFSK